MAIYQWILLFSVIPLASAGIPLTLIANITCSGRPFKVLDVTAVDEKEGFLDSTGPINVVDGFATATLKSSAYKEYKVWTYFTYTCVTTEPICYKFIMPVECGAWSNAGCNINLNVQLAMSTANC